MQGFNWTGGTESWLPSNPLIRKARKNLGISLSELECLTGSLNNVKKSTMISILKKLFRKHHSFKVAMSKNISLLGSQLCQSIKDLRLKSFYITKKEEKGMKKILCSLKNLKSWKIERRMNINFPSCREIGKLRKIKSLDFVPIIGEIIQNPRAISDCCSLKNLKLAIYSDLKDFQHSPQEKYFNFTQFCENMFVKSNLETLRLDVRCRRDLQFPMYDIMLQALNQSKITQFRLEFNLYKGQSIQAENLSKIFERTNSIVFKQDKHFSFEKDTMRSAREIIFITSNDVLFDPLNILKRCKSLRYLSFEDDHIRTNFPTSFGDINSLGTLRLEFPPGTQEGLKNSIENMIVALSKLSSLDKLVISYFPFTEETRYLLIKLHQLPLLKHLKSYHLSLPSDFNAKFNSSIFEFLYIALRPLDHLGDFKIRIYKNEDEKLLFKLLERFPGLKSLAISIDTSKDELELSLFFENLSRMQNLEKLSLEIPSKGLDKNKVLKGLPRLERLNELLIMLRSNKFDGNDIKIDYSDYQKYIIL